MSFTGCALGGHLYKPPLGFTRRLLLKAFQLQSSSKAKLPNIILRKSSNWGINAKPAKPHERLWMEQNFEISISPHEFDYVFTNTCFYHKLF